LEHGAEFPRYSGQVIFVEVNMLAAISVGVTDPGKIIRPEESLYWTVGDKNVN
jgi:hypothetical protein